MNIGWSHRFSAPTGRSRLSRTDPFPDVGCVTTVPATWQTALMSDVDIAKLKRVGCQKSAWSVSCSDAPGAAAGHDDRLCPFVCCI